MVKIANIRRLFTSGEQYLWLGKQTKPHIARLSALISFDIAAALLRVRMVTVTKTISSIAIGDVVASLALWVGLYVLISLSNLVLSSVSSVIKVSVTEKFSFSVRGHMFDKLLHARWLDVSAYHSGDLQTRLNSDVNVVTNSVISILPDLVSLVTLFTAAFISLYRESVFLANSTVLLVPIIILTTRIIGKRLNIIQKKVQESESVYSAFTQECLANLAIIKSFSCQEQSTKKLAQLHDDRFFWVKKRNRLSLCASGVFSLGYLAGYSIALAWGASQVMAGTITLPVMMQFSLLVSMIQTPIISLSRTIPQIITVLTSVDRLMELESIPAEYQGIESELPEKLEIVLDDVGFSYREGEPVLLSCNMRLRSGDMVALTGVSGVGKTTLVRMLLLLIEPNTGKMSIRADNRKDEQFSAALRNWIAYVPQGNTLFSGTIAENLRIGKSDACEREMWEALEAAGAGAFVEKLPEKLDTQIGERGLGLSEGQAQRIAIARALIRQCPIVILDEATSALDEKTESMVLDGISRRIKNTACLVITHRSSALSYCNRHFEMSNGVIREAGLKEERYAPRTFGSTN